MQLTTTQEIHLYHMLSAVTGTPFPSRAIQHFDPAHEKPFNGFIADETSDEAVKNFCEAMRQTTRSFDHFNSNMRDDLAPVRNTLQRYDIAKNSTYVECFNFDIAREQLASLVEVVTINAIGKNKTPPINAEGSLAGGMRVAIHCLNAALRPAGYSVALLTDEEISRGEIRMVPTLGDLSATNGLDAAIGTLDNGKLALSQFIKQGKDGSISLHIQDLDRNTLSTLIHYGDLLSRRNRLEAEQRSLHAKAKMLADEFKAQGFETPRAHLFGGKSSSDWVGR